MPLPNPCRGARGSALLVLVGLAASCGPSSSGNTITTTTGTVNGQQLSVIFDQNDGGKASSLQIVEIRWGRLVDVYDSQDDDGDPLSPPIRNLQHRDFLIADTIISDGANYLLETNPFTEQTELTILADADSDQPAAGSNESEAERFERLLTESTFNLGFVPPTGLTSGFLPPFPLVPRNAALSIRFNDLLDPSTINNNTVRVFTGSPQTQPFAARVVPNPNYGVLVDVNGSLQFRPTRILVDFTVSQTEAALTSLQVNSVGLPPSITNNLTNAVVRIPTKLDAPTGQVQLLRNLAGHTLDAMGSAPAEMGAPTQNVVRAFRSGRSDLDPTNNDPNNGFLLDVDAPQILGSQTIEFSGAPVSVPADTAEGDSPSDQVFLATLQFAIPACAQTPRKGNILRMTGTQFPDVFAQVTRQASPPLNGTATDVRVRLLPIPAGASAAAIRADFLASTGGAFQSVFQPGPGIVPECFLSISPTPGAPPTDLVDVNPQITVRFSEPMDPSSITPHDNFRMNRVGSASPGPRPDETIVGEVTATPDLREFSFRSVTALDHVIAPPGGTSSTDTYFVNLVGGADGVTDLAGNGLASALPVDIRLQLDGTQPTVRTGGIVLNFDEVDEDHNSPADPNPEVRGQFIYNFDRDVIVPRPVTRDSRVIDRTTPLYAIMTSTPSAILTPLAPLGSRMMTVWRYADAGFQVLDEVTANVDVEGIAWAPFAGSVSTDFFDLFEMSLSHSARLPDEFPIPISTGGGGYAMFQNSGLNKVFDSNWLKDPANSLKVVHPRDRGYGLTPSQVFTASTGTRMMPYPLNRGVAPEAFEYYTWRDTAILGSAGAGSFGADIKALVTVGAICDTTNPTVYDPGSIRSLALPLLMEFKCFPADAAGLNGLDTSFALATQNAPTFRIFSTGGFNKTGAPTPKNPDTQPQATGGFNGTTGVNVPGEDNTVMLGQLDLVVRVSRVYTIWFETKTQNPGFPDYLDPIVEPRPDDLPVGTRVVLAFRGATNVTGVDVPDARKYDAYGDPLRTRLVAGPNCPDPVNVPGSDAGDVVVETVADIVVTPFNSDSTWHSNIHDLDGAEFIQGRITFVSNAATGLTPELSTLALAFHK